MPMHIVKKLTVTCRYVTELLKSLGNLSFPYLVYEYLNLTQSMILLILLRKSVPFLERNKILSFDLLPSPSFKCRVSLSTVFCKVVKNQVFFFKMLKTSFHFTNVSWPLSSCLMSFLLHLQALQQHQKVLCWWKTLPRIPWTYPGNHQNPMEDYLSRTMSLNTNKQIVQFGPRPV